MESSEGARAVHPVCICMHARGLVRSRWHHTLPPCVQAVLLVTEVMSVETLASNFSKALGKQVTR